MADLPQYYPPPAAEHAPDPMAVERARWYKSLAALGAAHTADIASSWGHYEANPLLTSADGKFGAKGTAIKAGAMGGVALAEYLLAKKYPQITKYFKYLNYGQAVPLAVVAGRNFSMR